VALVAAVARVLQLHQQYRAEQETLRVLLQVKVITVEPGRGQMSMILMQVEVAGVMLVAQTLHQVVEELEVQGQQQQ
jgi:hypothetical protein